MTARVPVCLLEWLFEKDMKKKVVQGIVRSKTYLRRAPGFLFTKLTISITDKHCWLGRTSRVSLSHRGADEWFLRFDVCHYMKQPATLTRNLSTFPLP